MSDLTALQAPHRLIQAASGPPLGSDSPRRRAVGRIGGVVGRDGALTPIAPGLDPAAQERLARALGPGGQLLGASPGALVADWDACWREDGRPVQRLDDWRPLLSASGLARVEGAFSIAWREPDGTLVLARDAIGERTLFYCETRDGLVFASTIAALLASGRVARRINHVAVAAYLCYAYLPGRETLIDGVYELLPGELLRYTRGEISRSFYWQLPPEAPHPRPLSGAERGDDSLAPALCQRGRAQLTEDSPSPAVRERGSGGEGFAQELRRRLDVAVARRLPAGEAVGAFLSGGLDSSLVVALARRQHDAPLKTYSVSFGAGYANELPFSSLVAAHCTTEHRVVELSPAAVLHHLDETIGLLNDPIGDPLTVPNALLFREATQEVGVVLNGEGGDPSFGGPKNLPMVLAELLGDGASPDATDPLRRERSYLRAHGKCYDDLPAMLAADVQAALVDAPLEHALTPHLSDPRWPSFVAKLMALNVTYKGAHHILPKVDALSATFGVVPRAPLFDRAVVELAVGLPPQLRLRGSVEKFLLKQAVRDVLPPSIVQRPKSGMLVPVEAWFRGPLLPAARTRLLDGLAPYHLFEREYLERLLAGRLGGVRPRIGAKIWLLVTLEAWMRAALRG